MPWLNGDVLIGKVVILGDARGSPEIPTFKNQP